MAIAFAVAVLPAVAADLSFHSKLSVAGKMGNSRLLVSRSIRTSAIHFGSGVIAAFSSRFLTSERTSRRSNDTRRWLLKESRLGCSSTQGQSADAIFHSLLGAIVFMFINSKTHRFISINRPTTCGGERLRTGASRIAHAI